MRLSRATDEFLPFQETMPRRHKERIDVMDLELPLRFSNPPVSRADQAAVGTIRGAGPRQACHWRQTDRARGRSRAAALGAVATLRFETRQVQVRRRVADLAALAAAGPSVVTVLKTGQYAGLASFTDVGTFVPLQDDRAGQLVRQVVDWPELGAGGSMGPPGPVRQVLPSAEDAGWHLAVG